MLALVYLKKADWQVVIFYLLDVVLLVYIIYRLELVCSKSVSFSASGVGITFKVSDGHHFCIIDGCFV